MTSFASEFTPELSEGYLANLLNRRVAQHAGEIGSARQEGESAGLIGQAAQGSRIGAAEENFGRDVNSDVANFNLDVAGKKYSERMNDERQAFSATEAQKNRDFQEKMTNLGYQRSVSDREAREAGSLHAAERGMLTGTAVGLLTPSASFMGMGVNPHANDQSAAAGGKSGGGDFSGSDGDHPQMGGMSGQGEGADDLAGNSWGF